MKKLLLTLVCVCLYLTGWAQRPLVEPYVLGLIDDHKGRVLHKETTLEKALIDKFHSTENGLVLYLDSLLKLENKRTYDKVPYKFSAWEEKDCFYCQEFKLFHSQKLSEKINEAYTFRLSKDKDARARKEYVGTLKNNLFKTDKERYSFLAGAFVRYGNRENDNYNFNLPESMSKFEAILNELKALRCEIVRVEEKDGNPRRQLITFIPTEELRDYLGKQEALRASIQLKKQLFRKESEKNNKSLEGIFSSSDE